MNIDRIETDNRFGVNINSDAVNKLGRARKRPRQAEQDVKKTARQNVNVTDDRLDQTVKTMGKIAEAMNAHLKFSIDELTGKTIVKIINSDTGEVLRQIPPEETLRIMSKMQDIIGLLFDRKA